MPRDPRARDAGGMATYCTVEQLAAFLGEAELISLTDLSGDGEVDTARVENALVYADGLINGYVGSRYSLPLPVVPQLLTELARDLAHYRLYPQQPLEHVKDAYEAALKQLKDVSKGQLALDLGPDAAPAAQSSRLASHGQAKSGFDWAGYHG